MLLTLETTLANCRMHSCKGQSFAVLVFENSHCIILVEGETFFKAFSVSDVENKCATMNPKGSFPGL